MAILRIKLKCPSIPIFEMFFNPSFLIFFIFKNPIFERILFGKSRLWELREKVLKWEYFFGPHKLAAMFPNSILCIEKKIGNIYQIISCKYYIEDKS